MEERMKERMNRGGRIWKENEGGRRGRKVRTVCGIMKNKVKKKMKKKLREENKIREWEKKEKEERRKQKE